MGYVNADFTKTYPFVESSDLERFSEDVSFIHKMIHTAKNAEAGSLGFIDHPYNVTQKELYQIQKAAMKVKADSDIFLIIGVGGSYLGARAAIEALGHSFQNYLTAESRSVPQIFFVGNNMSATYIKDLKDLLHDKDFSINVISKSGETLETAIAFRIFRELLERRYGKKGARERIYVTTDQANGLLRNIAATEGFETFSIPRNIGGRFSVLSAVGLFPMAVSGICIDEVIRGAIAARRMLSNPEIQENPAYLYAVVRNILYEKDKTIEILVSYEPSFQYLLQWWKQLYAESEGKEHSGIFPATAIYSTDLHSLGQYVQEGRRDLFETNIIVDEMQQDLLIEEWECNLDQLNYLGGKTLNDIKDRTFESALQAHTEGGVPNIILRIPKIDEFHFGYLVYFFQLSCAMSGYLSGVNPFNQPGVEAYKKNLLHALNGSRLDQTTII
ncbi:glucose-6-phosphate isomerase [Lederbergia citrisecunda]|uniref:glucose-6-phosphate isomerase n=1 Tax=Lederbergia citrisecunda TaxID=2833583 RepID=UPI003D27C8E2